jgi:hypothetical protein
MVRISPPFDPTNVKILSVEPVLVGVAEGSGISGVFNPQAEITRERMKSRERVNTEIG